MELLKDLLKLQKSASREYDKVFKNLPPDLSWTEFENMLKPASEKSMDISRRIRMIKEPKFENIPDYGDVMSLKNFIENVECGGFIDYDGSGNYVRDGKMSDISIEPSDVDNNSVRKDFDTIVWFNK
jgi:hypothetical protein